MQKINLYLEEFRDKKVPFSFETLAFFFFGSLMFCIMGTVLVFILYTTSGENIRITQEELHAAEDAFKQAQQQYKIIEKDLRIESQIEILKKQKSENKKLLAYLDNRELADQHSSFSKILEALTTISEPGLWLNEIRLDQAGSSLGLSGYSNEANQVPSYIKKLGEKPAFLGMQFRVFDMKREDGLLAFTLSSKRFGNETDQTLLESLGGSVRPTEAQ